MSTAHALLSASSAHKWINCTPSPRLEEQFIDTTSDYAIEGTVAHEVGELKLRKAFVEPMGQRAFNSRLKELQKKTFTTGENAGKPIYQDEMMKHTDTYFDYVSKIIHSFPSPPHVVVEKKIDYSAYAPEGFGTADNLIIGQNMLHVNDFKYGKGVKVSADHNPQMMLYALGAYVEYSFLYPIERVKMAIIQPRLDNISEFEMSITDLLAWGESIKPIAQLAFKGEGEFMPGEWCRFCRAKARCRARSEFNMTLEKSVVRPLTILSNEEIGALLARAQEVAKWAKELIEYALSECLKGNVIPGWKAVHGRGNRAFIDVDGAFKVLTAAGFDEALLYKREPLSPAQIEDLIGKKTYKELLTSKVNTPPGKPTLAPIDDKREAISNQPDPKEDFAAAV